MKWMSLWFRIFLFGLVSDFGIYAQIPSKPSEFLLHTDKPFYINGETVWFKLYLPESWKGQSPAIKTTIFNSRGNLSEQFFLTSGGEDFVSGHLSLPYEDPSGFLEFQFAASPGRSVQEIRFAHFHVPFYNDLEIIDNSRILSEGFKSSQENHRGESKSSVELITKSPDCRKPVEGRMVLRDDAGLPIHGHVSISVTEITSSTSQLPVVQSFIYPYIIDPATLVGSAYVTGKVFDENKLPLQINVLGGYVNDDKKIYYSKSDKSGAFFFEVPAFTGKKSLQLVGFQYEKMDFTSQLDIPEYIGTDRVLPYDSLILNYLALSRLRKQIYQHFGSTELPDLKGEEIKIVPPVWKPDALYQVKQYESFKDMKSFFGELLTPLRFRMEKDSTYKATLFNAKGGRRSNTILNGPPLFLIDGKLTRDADFVARLPISAVEEVELFLESLTLRNYFQAIGVSGVVKIRTTLSNLKLPEQDQNNLHSFTGFLAKCDFPELQAYQNDRENKTPIFRSLIYWDDHLKSDEEGQVSFSFNHTDDTGTFQIITVAQNRILSRLVYQVK